MTKITKDRIFQAAIVGIILWRALYQLIYEMIVAGLYSGTV